MGGADDHRRGIRRHCHCPLARQAVGEESLRGQTARRHFLSMRRDFASGQEHCAPTVLMSALGRCCSLIPGLDVKLSTTFLAGPTVLSAVGACPPHDGVRRRWWINVESAVALSSARQASNDLTTATVPAGTSFPPCRGNPVISFYAR